MFKKISFLLVLVLLIATLSGCGNDQYAMERKFWYTQKQANNIFKNPHAAPPQELARVVSVLREFIEQNPDSELSIQQEFTIGRLYAMKENYDLARGQFDKIIEKYSDNAAVCSEAVFLIGNTYLIEEKEDLAFQQYKRIMQEYPLTKKCLEIPIIIAKQHEVKHNPEKMVDAYKSAIVYYDSMALKYQDSVYGFLTGILKGQCYVALKDWQSAIGVFNVVVLNYRGKVAVDQPLFNIALIYKEQLKDANRTRLALERLIKEHPKSRFIKIATEMLEELSEGD